MRYDPIFKVMCHNMNYFTQKADEDFGVDESTWGFMGYSGECGGRLMNKMVSKGEFSFEYHFNNEMLLTHYYVIHQVAKLYW